MFELTLDSVFGKFLILTAPEQRAGSPQCELSEKSMLSLFRRVMKNNQGATAIEYTLIVSLIAVAAIASMRSVSSKVSSVLGSVGNSVI